MRCQPPFQWTVWITIFSIGLLQTYVIYSSVSRYLKLKSEIFIEFYKPYIESNWIFYLLNFQLFIIIGALGTLPLWVYSLIFSLSSFLCNEDSPQLSRQGFQDLVFKEAIDILKSQRNEKNQLNENHSKTCSCQRKIKMNMFYPMASIFYVFISYSLLLPVPFVESWLIQIDHKNKEEVSTNDLDFFVSNTLTIKIKWSVEYFNFLISLSIFSLQYPNIIWTTNKLFSIAFSLLEFLIVLHILIDFPIISIVIKTFFKNCKTCTSGTNTTLAYSFLLLSSSIVGNIFLLLTFFPIFQFAFEKCVQTLLNSSWFIGSYHNEFTGSTSNIDQLPCQSTASRPETVREIKTSFYPYIFSALFFILGITVKGVIYYQYQEFRRNSKLFIIYLIQSLTLAIVYFMFWFGISLKPKWTFSLNEIKKRRISPYSLIQKEESNFYKSSRRNFKTSQLSLSSISNTNLSIHSSQVQPLNRMDFTNVRPYRSRCNSLKLPAHNKMMEDSSDYLQINQHLPHGRMYQTLHSSISSPKPLIEDFRSNLYLQKGEKLPMNNIYKCVSSFTSMKPKENIRLEDIRQTNRKCNMEFSIKEETNDNLSSISDDVSSNVTSSPSNDLNNKNNPNMKFVTFRLDTNAEIAAAEISPSSSNESLTVISLEPSDAFIKELEGENSDKIHFKSFKDGINSEFRDKFMMHSDSQKNNPFSYPSNKNHSQISLL